MSEQTIPVERCPNCGGIGDYVSFDGNVVKVIACRCGYNAPGKAMALTRVCPICDKRLGQYEEHNITHCAETLGLQVTALRAERDEANKALAFAQTYWMKAIDERDILAESNKRANDLFERVKQHLIENRCENPTDDWHQGYRAAVLGVADIMGLLDPIDKRIKRDNEKVVGDNPKPARSAAECIDRLRLENEDLRTCLGRLMYWMDKAREAQPIDLEKFNQVWDECTQMVRDKEAA